MTVLAVERDKKAEREIGDRPGIEPEPFTPVYIKCGPLLTP